jgi:hypothetical protein
VDGAGLQHVRLQSDAEGDLLFFTHCGYPHLTVRTEMFETRPRRAGGL